MPEAEAGLATPTDSQEQPVVAQTPATPEVTEKPERTFTQKELDEILEKRLSKERRRYSQAQRRIGELSAAPPQPKVEGKSDAPKRDAFDSYEDYLEAKASFAAEKAADRKLSEQHEANKKYRDEEAERERADTWGKRQKLGREKYKDFDDVTTSDDVPISRPMAEAIMESELGHELAYYLGKNPEEAERIADLSPTRQAVEIGKLEAKLSETPKPKASRAPEPIDPIKGGGGTPDTGLSDDLSTAEWIRRRTKQVRGK